VFAGTETVKLSRTNVAYGTAHYMAPEQATGGKVDPRADLYAVGMMLYRVLSGRLPYERVSGPMVLVHQVHSDVPPLPVEVSPSLRAVAYRALQKRPRDRFADAGEFLAALERAAVDPGFLVPGGEVPVGLPMPGRG